jgi:transposase-like protein
MNSNKIASELVKIAKELTAGYGYPVGVELYKREDIKETIDALREGVKDKKIYNVKFKKYNDTINSAFDTIKEEIRNVIAKKYRYEKFNAVHYFIMKNLVSLTSLKSRIKDIDNFLKNPDFGEDGERWFGNFESVPEITDDLIKAFKEYKNFLESWLEIPILKKEAKKYIVKGRIPDPNKPVKEVYRPPMQSMVSLGKVKQLLEGVMADKRSEFTKSIQDNLIANASGFIKTAMDKKLTSFEYYGPRSPMRRTIDDMVDIYVDGQLARRSPMKFSPESEIFMELKSDAKATAEKFAKSQVEFIAEKFILKNMSKLTSIIGEKERAGSGLIKAEETGTTIKGMSLSGILVFAFSDNTSFVVHNQAVWSMNYFGTTYVRYPTTFHNVVFKDGKKKAKLSEKQMNEQWAKE